MENSFNVKFDLMSDRQDGYGNISQKCPMCEDGWLKFRTSHTEKNNNRSFWTCPKATRQYPQSKGCGFFVWQDTSEEEMATEFGKKRAKTGVAFTDVAYAMPDVVNKEIAELKLSIDVIRSDVLMLQHRLEGALATQP